MLLNLTEFSEEPLHQQISRQVREKVLAGELHPGEALPSIRSLAREAKVSVITVQRAYEDLEREGLLQVARGKGFFVGGVDESAKQDIARRRLVEGLAPALGEAKASGLSDEVILSEAKKLLKGVGS